MRFWLSPNDRLDVDTFEKVLTRLPYVIAYALSDDPEEGSTLIVLHIIHTARNWPEGHWPRGG